MTVPFSDVELTQLLARPVRRVLSAADRRAFAGAAVLITGGGGSVGSALARQVADCRPSRLTLVDHSELALVEIARDLADRTPQVAVETVLADVSQAQPVRRVLHATAPDIVFHAAAYKHVAMVERDVCAAVRVNVLGTLNVVQASRAAAARFVLVSTDKAAAPRSVMGASKRLAELVTLGEATAAFRPIVVRFGNVLGSSGSLLAVLRDRVRRGWPLRITDLAATRYVMTADEAVSLVLKAHLLARGAEVYWLDMGAPVRIGDLVDRLLAIEEAAGFARVPIEVVGLGPGEKQCEALTTQGLRMCATAHRRIWMARQRVSDRDTTRRAVEPLGVWAARGDAERTLHALAQVVPGFVASDEAWTSARRQSAAAGCGPLRQSA